jgi:hypothetical protein
MVSGALAVTVHAPLTVPFVLFGAVLAVAAIGVALAPETVTPPEPRPAYRPQRVAVPRESRGRFFGAAAACFVAFATFGLFTSLAPTFLAGTLGNRSHLLAGVPAFTAFEAAVVAQLAAAAWDVRRLLGTGMAALSAGIAMVVTATWLPSLGLFLVGGVVAGAGAGLLFKGGIVTASSLAAPDRRAEVLAGFYLAGYLGISVPVLGLGILGELVAPRVGLLGFAALLLAGIAASARTLLAGAQRSSASSDAGRLQQTSTRPCGGGSSGSGR